jgi:UDP-N-acetyl-D-mannosaminuronic acid transferase (WecB/TagA/CpsF family)
MVTQKYGLEWLWRMLHNPRRLAPRYARCVGAIPKLLVATLPQILQARFQSRTGQEA